MKNKLAVLSAGGTGGHVTPAKALYEDLHSRGFDVHVISDTRGARFQPLFGDAPFHIVRSGTLGRGIYGKIKGLFNLVWGIASAYVLLKRLKPDVVVGFGGYPSVPGVFAAQKLKIPTVLHEQNAVIGKANAFLAPKADRIAISMPIDGVEVVDHTKTIVTGNPVRGDIASLYFKPYPELLDEGLIRILILGGSLGAGIFSRVVPAALEKLSTNHKGRIKIVQQCRQEDIEQVRACYDELGVDASLSTFVNDIAGELEAAHLVISRSGASTVAEVAAAGRPAIFVPLNVHKDQQQKMNADAMADHGGAWVMPEEGFTPDTLLARLENFLQNPRTLFKAAENARACGKPDAARKLGNLVTALARGWDD